MKYSIIDFKNCSIKTTEAKSSAEAFNAIQLIETPNRKKNVECSTIEKPYVVKMSEERYGFIYPSDINEKEYCSSAYSKAKKKHEKKTN